MTLEQTNELQIILHQIRDLEWNLEMNHATQQAIMISARITKASDIDDLLETINNQHAELKSLRNKRDNLLKQNI
jgi:hypothetical protein